MKQIKPSNNPQQWPRHKVESVECRERDLIIRITDWMDDAEEPAYDVEVYIGGVYDYNESRVFTMYEHKDRAKCKSLATAYAQEQIKKLL
jgi:hypothetical protein